MYTKANCNVEIIFKKIIGGIDKFMEEKQITKAQVMNWIACTIQVVLCVIGIIAAMDHEIAQNNKQKQKMAALNTKLEMKKKKADFKMQNKLDKIVRKNQIQDAKREAKAQAKMAKLAFKQSK